MMECLRALFFFLSNTHTACRLSASLSTVYPQAACASPLYSQCSDQDLPLLTFTMLSVAFSMTSPCQTVFISEISVNKCNKIFILRWMFFLRIHYQKEL